MSAPAFDIRIQHAAELHILGRPHPRQSLASFARWALVHPHVFGFGRLHEVRVAAREVLAELGEPAPTEEKPWVRVRSLWEVGG